MAIWQREYYVSYTVVLKTKPIKIRANSENDAFDKLRILREEGHMEEEERKTDYSIIEVNKKY